MTVQEVAKAVMRVTGNTQQTIADKAGLAGQSTISMYLRSKSMRVEAFLMILNSCGYELVARSVDGKYPEFVIGDEAKPENVAVNSENEEAIRDMVRKILAEEIEKGTKRSKK